MPAGPVPPTGAQNSTRPFTAVAGEVSSVGEQASPTKTEDACGVGTGGDATPSGAAEVPEGPGARETPGVAAAAEAPGVPGPPGS